MFLKRQQKEQLKKRRRRFAEKKFPSTPCTRSTAAYWRGSLLPKNDTFAQQRQQRKQFFDVKLCAAVFFFINLCASTRAHLPILVIQLIIKFIWYTFIYLYFLVYQYIFWRKFARRTKTFIYSRARAKYQKQQPLNIKF